ncbi:MAG TPA: Fic family protein [Solirubrobacterales bacterium]|nr:Fic family protein [Solirubrobacterales bacterium]
MSLFDRGEESEQMAFRGETLESQPMTDNRFARKLTDLDSEERQLVGPAASAARRTFAGFAEKPGSEYHQAPGLTPEKTWKAIATELGRVSALTTLEGNRDRPLEAADIELIHRGIFEPVFGEKTLGFRSRKGDEVTFPIVVGSREEPRRIERRGSGGKQVLPNLGRALKGFERELEALDSRRAPDKPNVSDAALPAVKLYAKVIGTHPFFDGNGRTAWAVFSYALQRCGLVEVAGPPTPATRWALGRALRDGGSQSYDPLTAIVAETIKGSSLETDT